MSRSFLIFCALALAGSVLAAPTSGPSGMAPSRASSPVEQALQRAQLLGRPALIYFQMQGCSWCRKFETEVLSQDAVKQRLEAFEVIKADLIDQKDLALRYGVRGAPAFVVITPAGEPAGRWTGFLDRDKFFSLLAAATAPSGEVAAVPSPEGPEVVRTPSVIAKLRKAPFGSLTAEELAEFVTLTAEAATRPLAEEILKEKKEFPAGLFVPLLRHPLLAVRLGALQLLEDHAGEAFGFDPWAEAPSANSDALIRWEAWAAGAQTPRSAASDPEALAGRINDLLSPDTIRSQRGFRALLREGPAAAEAAARFSDLNPSLPPEQRSRLRELRYAILLSGLGVQDAEPLSHLLIFGNLDVRLQAMNKVANLGPKTLPLLEDFLASREPLEREAAVDGILRAAGPSALPLIATLLKDETDANVIHVALRKLGDAGGDSAPLLLEAFVAHENEDLAIAALEGLGRLKAKNSAPSVRAALKDPRWRVRVSALKTTSDLEISEAGDEVRSLLSDPDEFVRISAVQAAAKMRLPGASQKLNELFLEQDALKPAIVQSYSRMDNPIPDSFLAALEKSPPDVVLAVLGSVPDADAKTLPLLRWAVGHKNEDIACAALRLLAAEGLDNADNRALVARALQSGSRRKIQTVLQAAAFDRNDIAQALPSANQVSFDSGPGADRGTSLPADSSYAGLARAVGALKLDDENDRLDAAIILASLGDSSGLDILEGKTKSLAASQRARLAGALSVQRTAPSRPLFAQLLDDPEPEVRRAAINALFAEGSNGSCVDLAFDVLQKPGSRLQPQEVTSHRLTSRYSIKAEAAPGYRDRYLEALRTTSDPALQVLALYLLGYVWSPDCAAAVAPFLSSENPRVRRAAFYSLGRNDPAAREALRDRLLADTSPAVRVVFPALCISGSFYWKTPLSETETTSSYQSESDVRGQPAPSAEDLAALKKLSEDPDATVRLFAGLGLFTNLAPLDTVRFAALVKQSPDARMLSYTFRNVFQQKVARMPEDYAVLVSLADTSGDERLAAAIAARFPAGVASTPPAEIAVTGGVIASVATPPPAPPVSSPGVSAEVPLYYFSKPGCSHCAQVKAMLARVAESFPELRVTELNINKNQSMELNETLSRRFGVPENLRLVAPAIFTSAGFLVKDDIGEERLGDLILRARDPGNEPLSAALAETTSPAAAQAITERYARINPGVIIAAGALDGLNPCAFATIIFLLSYLQVARKTPREMAQIGVAYVAGVFSAYFLLGLGLSEIVARVVVFRQAALVLNVGMGLFALVIAVLSFRDGVRCLQGRLQEISLQLPSFLKDRIRGVIRKSVPHRGFVAAAFGVGAFISLLELACTGQVYAPTILYMIQAGQGGAVGYLLLYNVAFILPLTVIFILAFFGLTSGKLTALLQRHAAVVKFGMALLFLVLAFLLFAREWQG